MALNVAREPHKTRASPQSVIWRTFLRGLAMELNAQAGSDVSITILRGVGHRMAGLLPLIAVDSLEALELEMNLVLDEIGWGRIQLTLLEAERCVVMVHIGLPQIGSAGEPPGTWLAPVLEGLCEGWMGQQPGANESFRARTSGHEGDKFVLRYGR